MNTWIFSKNGKVTEPLAIAEAKNYVVENQDAYAWQSGYTQWLPVHSISEFQALLPELESTAQIPQVIIDEFLSKEQTLNQYFDEMNQKLTYSESNASLFAQEIENYKKLTASLSPEMKGNINDVEQQYLALEAKLNNIKQVVNLSQTKLNTVVNEFNEKVSTKSVKNTVEPQQDQKTKTNAPSIQLVSTGTVKAETEKGAKPEKKVETEKSQKPEQKAESTKVAKVEQPTETEKNSKAENTAEQKDNSKVAPEVKKVPTAKVISTRAPKRVDIKKVNTRPSDSNDNNSTSTKESVVTKNQASEKVETVKVSNGKAKPLAEKEPIVEVQVEGKGKTANVASPNNLATEENDDKNLNLQSKLESGVKNIFKSVFTKEEPVTSKNIFTDIIEKDNKNEDVKQPATEAVSAEDEILKAPRRRRRR